MAGMKQELAQQIVETVKETCGYDINYITERGIVMASTDPTRIGTYHEVGHLAGQSGETIEVEKEGQYEGTQPGVNIPFYFHHVLVGIIGITGKPEEVRRYGQLAVRIMRLILKEKDLEQSLEVRRMQNTYILHQMMEGEAVNEKMLKEFLQVHHLNEKTAYRMILVTARRDIKNTHTNSLENRIDTWLSQWKEMVRIFDYPGTFIILISSRLFEENAERWKQLAEMSSVAAGGPYSINRISRSYQEARITQKSMEGHFGIFDTLPLTFLLSNVSEHVRKAFLNRTLSGLNDRQKEILFVYYRHQMSLKDTAESLHIHKNTLQYQLERIKEACGWDPRLFHDAVSLYLALQMEKQVKA